MTFNALYQLIIERGGSFSYSCLMLDCQFLYNEIEKMHNEICPCDISEEHGLEKESHITVLYGLHCDKFSTVLNKVDLNVCRFKIKDISLFENEKYDILKFGIESPDLHKINKELRERLPYTSSFDVYHAHLTIAYLKPGTGKNYLKLKNKLIGKTFSSDQFIFSSHTGDKVYHTVN
jgi:2'-5' RNA ligase